MEAGQSEASGDSRDHHGKDGKNHQKCAHTGNRHRRPALISAFLPEQFYTAQLLLAGIHGGIQNIGEHKSPEERLQKQADHSQPFTNGAENGIQVPRELNQDITDHDRCNCESHDQAVMPAALVLEKPFLSSKAFLFLLPLLFFLLFIQLLPFLSFLCRRGSRAYRTFRFHRSFPVQILIGSFPGRTVDIRAGPLLIFPIGVFPGDTHFYNTFHKLPPLFYVLICISKILSVSQHEITKSIQYFCNNICKTSIILT